MTITELIERIERIRATRGDGCNQVADVLLRWDQKELAELLRETFGCCGNRVESVAEVTGEYGDRWREVTTYCFHTGRPCGSADMKCRTPSQEELLELVSFIERAKQ